MNKCTITYYKLPLHSIPFEEIPSLENKDYKYVFCNSMSLQPFMGIDLYLTTIYNAFDNAVKDIAELDGTQLLFGKIICDKISTRGKEKAIKLGAVDKLVSQQDLPDLRVVSKPFYMTQGNYFLFKAIESEYSKVNHLETNILQGDSIIRLRVVIELLKQNTRLGLLHLDIKQFKDIAFKVLRSDSVLEKTEDSDLTSYINSTVPEILAIPLFQEIPEQFRGKVKN
jgi:hypothetical protein